MSNNKISVLCLKNQKDGTWDTNYRPVCFLASSPIRLHGAKLDMFGWLDLDMPSSQTWLVSQAPKEHGWESFFWGYVLAPAIVPVTSSRTGSGCPCRLSRHR